MNATGDGEAGQALILFALMAAVLVAMLVLVVDASLLFGQQRYAQNSADAAALAAGRLVKLKLATDHLQVYREVRRYAGLDPTNLTSAVPTGVNQLPGLTGRTQLAVTLEYNNGTGWCAAPYGLRPPGPPDCGAVLPPFSDVAPYQMRVTVSGTTDGFFARSLGIGDPSPPAGCLRPTGAPGITTCATATVAVQAGQGAGEYAIFAGETGCAVGRPGVDLTGSGANIVGEVHSNTEIRVAGSGHHFGGPVTVGCANGLQISGSGDSIPNATQIPPLDHLPLSYTIADFPCTWDANGAVSGTRYASEVAAGTFRVGQNGAWWASANHLKPGVYCANGDITLTGSGTRGIGSGPAQVTFIATGTVSILGSGHSFAPYSNNVFIAAFGSPSNGAAADFSGSGITWGGIAFAPNGLVKVSGSGNQIVHGAVVAQAVDISGSGWTLDGSGQGVHDGSRTVTLTA